MNGRSRYALGGLLLSLACVFLNVGPSLAHGRVNDGHAHRLVSKPATVAKAVRMVQGRSSTGSRSAVSASPSEPKERFKAKQTLDDADKSVSCAENKIGFDFVVFAEKQPQAVVRGDYTSNNKDAMPRVSSIAVVIAVASDLGVECCPDGHGCCCQGLTSCAMSSCCGHAAALSVIGNPFVASACDSFTATFIAFADSIVVAPGDRPPASSI